MVRITKNERYDEYGKHIDRLSPQQMKALVEALEQRSPDLYGKGPLPYAPVLRDKSWLRDYLIPPIKGDRR